MRSHVRSPTATASRCPRRRSRRRSSSRGSWPSCFQRRLLDKFIVWLKVTHLQVFGRCVGQIMAAAQPVRAIGKMPAVAMPARMPATTRPVAAVSTAARPTVATAGMAPTRTTVAVAATSARLPDAPDATPMGVSRPVAVPVARPAAQAQPQLPPSQAPPAATAAKVPVSSSPSMTQASAPPLHHYERAERAVEAPAPPRAQAESVEAHARAVGNPSFERPPHETSHEPPPADGGKWMPQWASSADKRRADAAVRSSRDSALGEAIDIKGELERVQQSYTEVTRERDLLKSHVRSMEKLVQQQLAGKTPGRPPPRPTSAPPTARSSDKETARRRLTKEAEQDMMRRLNGRAWRPDRNKPGSGVEQLQRKIMDQEKRLNEKAREEFSEGKKSGEKKSRRELEEACAEMFKRATQRRQRLNEELSKKAEAQLPTHKKSAAKPLQRDMHFQRLAMPNASRRMPRQNYHVRGSSAAEAARQQRPAWFGGTTGKQGTLAGSTDNLRAGAVH